MIQYRKAGEEDMELLMESRLEMLRVVNDLPADYEYSKELVEQSRRYFEYGNQTTVFAIVEEKVIGCATLCYIDLMPTFSHPTGKRAHLMNVYTNSAFRRQGIGFHMVQMLIQEAKEKGVTEISLDATESGRPLYQKCGFQDSGECMVMTLNE